MIKVEPIGDRVVAERIETKPGEERHGSIYIPDTAKDAPLLAKVIAVGPGRSMQFPSAAVVEGLVLQATGYLGGLDQIPLTVTFKPEPMQVSVGDLIIYGRYSGAEVPINVDGKIETVFMLRQDEILGILKGIEKSGPPPEPEPADDFSSTEDD